MTIETIKKTDAGQEIKIVDVSGADRGKGARRSAAVLLVAALAFGLAIAAVAEGAHVSIGFVDELPEEGGDDDVIPWDKPPIPEMGSESGGVKPAQLPT
jgi:hypothetical protein